MGLAPPSCLVIFMRVTTEHRWTDVQKNCDLQGAERVHSVLINPNIICLAVPFGYSALLDGGSLFLSSRVSRVSLSTALVFAWYRVELAGVSPLFHQSFLKLTLAFDFRVLLMIGHICAPAFSVTRTFPILASKSVDLSISVCRRPSSTLSFLLLSLRLTSLNSPPHVSNKRRLRSLCWCVIR